MIKNRINIIKSHITWFMEETLKVERSYGKTLIQWRHVHQKRQGGFLVVDILRESVDRLSRYNDLARMGSWDSKDRRGGAPWFERFQLARLNTPMKWRSLALTVRWDYDDADGEEEEEEEEDSARVWLNTRAVVISFTLRRERTSGARWGQSDAPKTWAILPRTGIGEENSDAATRVGALLACQCTNHSPFTPFSATLV